MLTCLLDSFSPHCWHSGFIVKLWQHFFCYIFPHWLTVPFWMAVAKVSMNSPNFWIPRPGRLWTRWRGDEPSVAQKKWKVVRPGPRKCFPWPLASPHSAPSPASAPATAASPGARGSPWRAWASGLQPISWRCVSQTCQASHDRDTPDLLTRLLTLCKSCLVCCFLVKGRNGLAESNAGRTFHKRSFVRPSWMDEDMVDSADTSESIFFSKVSLPTRSLAFIFLFYTTHLFVKQHFFFACQKSVVQAC